MGRTPVSGVRRRVLQGMDNGSVSVFYAYVLTWDRDLDLPDLDGGLRLRKIAHAGLSLIVSELRLAELEVEGDDTTATATVARLARRHDRAVQAVFDQMAVLPLRFCTLLTDTAEARHLLTADEGRARQRLDELSGRREWGVRLVGNGAADPETVRPVIDAAEARLSSYATERLRRREIDLDPESSSVTGLDSSRDGPEIPLSNVAYLVHRMTEQAFLAEVGRLRGSLAQQGIDVRSTGPWPPYSFAQIDWAIRQRT